MYRFLRSEAFFCFIVAALTLSAQDDSVTYKLTLPRYYKDGNLQSGDPKFVSGTRGDFVVFDTGTWTSGYACNEDLPQGYYASSWQLDKAWGTSASGTTIASWDANNSITVTFDYKWKSKYGSNLELIASIDQMIYGYSYDAGGGVWAEGQPTGGSDVKYWITNTAASASCVTKEGHTFKNWRCSKGGTLAAGSSFTGSDLGISSNDETVKLTAEWEANTYTATIAAGTGGSGGSAVDYTYSTSSQTIKITLPTYDTGHSITAWTLTGDYAGSSPTISGDILTIPARTRGNFTMTPIWTAVKCSLGLSDDGNGSTSAFPSGASQTYGLEIKITATPKDGYAFAYWDSTVEPKTIYENPHTFTIVQDVQFQANFTQKVCTVTFDANGGSCSESRRFVTWGEQVGALPKPTYGTRDFKGWYNAQVGGTAVTQDAVIEGDKTFYAQWGAAVTYTITTIASPKAGGTITGGGVHDKDTVTNLVAKANDGYSFERWEDTGSTDVTRQITVTDNATYTACFTGNVYRAYLQGGEGDVPKGYSKFYVKFGSPYNFFMGLPVPVPPPGQKFVGWFTEEEGGYQVSDDTIVETANNHQLWAHYEDIVYCPLELILGAGISNITYSIDGNGQTTTTNATVQVELGASWSAVVYNGDVYPGYAWNDSCNCTSGMMTTAGAIFAPTGTPNTISVTYNANRDKVTGSTPQQDFQYNVPGNLRSNGFSLAYAVSFKIDAQASESFATSNSVQAFDGWSTNSGVAQVIYANGALVTNICGSTGTVKGTPIDLWAQWTTNAESVIILPSAPEKEGYSFNGWYLIEESSTNKVGDVGEKYVPVADTTLVGGWDLNSYDLAITVNEGIGEITYATGRKTGVGQNPPWDWKTTSESCTIEDVSFGTEWHAYVSKVKEGYVYTGKYVSESENYTGKIGTNESENVFAPVATKKTPGALTLTIGKGIEKIRYAIGEEPLVWEETTTSATVAVSCGVAWQAYALARAGYTTNSTCAKFGTMAEAGDTFTPSADANPFRVSYDPNGATGGAMEDSNFTYDQDGQLPANGYTRSYAVMFNADGGTVTNASGEVMDPAVANSVYTFEGWATNLADAASRRVSYTDGQSVRNLSTGDPVTLYAVWTTNESSAVTMPGAKRDEDLLLGWQDTAGSRVYGVGTAFIPTNDTTLVAQWQIGLNDLSRAVGLTNAVLRAVADDENGFCWSVQTNQQGTGITPWDKGHAPYVRFVNKNEGKKEISDSSPLKLYLNLSGSGRLIYTIYKNPNNPPTVTVVDISADGFEMTNNVFATKTKDWQVVTNKVEAGAHEIRWLVSGESRNTDRICLDNMSWTPDAEPTPEPTPVVPGGEMPTYGTEDAAKEAAQSAVVARPNAEVSNVVDEVTYNAMFDVKPVPTGSGDAWTLAIQLKEGVSNEVQAALNEAETNLCSVITNNPISVSVAMKPGLYYGLAATNEVEWLSLAVPAEWVLGGGGETSVSAPRPSETNAFYQVRMAITKPK